MKTRWGYRVLWACVILYIGGIPSLWAESPTAGNTDALSAKMCEVIRELDALESAGLPSWEEYIVLLYERIQGREPTTSEFAALCGLRDQIGLKPSEALSLVLRGDLPGPTYPQIDAFLTAKTADTFVADAHVRAMARRLAAACATEDWEAGEEEVDAGMEKCALEPDPPGIEYHVFFGYVHAHSRLSDGEGTPLEAYTYARDIGQLDFFALTDHAELLMLWPWENKWAQLREAADQTDEPGRFAALHGFEWTNPILGHINVINSDDFTHVLQNFSIPSLYRWLAWRPAAFGQYNHPGSGDAIGPEFLHFRLFPRAVPQMVGVELWNGRESFDFFYYGGSWDSGVSYIDVANQNGWQLGALGDQDNHSANWGTQTDFRTAVLAVELNRAAILDAYRHRRFYSTEDKDLRLDFRCAGYPMGSHVQDAIREFRVTASDDSGDTFAEVRLYRNGDLIETKAVEGPFVDVILDDTAGQGDDYYYVIVRQNDDNDGNGRNDEAISSPIWADSPSPPPMGCAGICPANASPSADARADLLVTILMIGVLLYQRRRFLISP